MLGNIGTLCGRPPMCSAQEYRAGPAQLRAPPRLDRLEDGADSLPAEHYGDGTETGPVGR